jgi:oligoendopeptidase F
LAWDDCLAEYAIDGDALSEYDGMFWATKLHFYMTSPQFYNFPYTFGYLFALGVYAQSSASGGAGFHARYVALLRDTGRMTAEDLVAKHLGVTIAEPAFWEASCAIVDRKVDAFERALDELGL